MTDNPTCGHPDCTRKATQIYTGPNDNRLRLCERHYYDLVSGGSGGSSPVIDNGGTDPINSFWDGGIRSENSIGDVNYLLDQDK